MASVQCGLVTQFDVVVVGAGHAGIEAASAAARMGLRVACVTLRLDRIGHLPCNCSVGGPAKGHIAREVDALDGWMGVATDHTLTHIRKVGTRKGPAVQTLRAHVCKAGYPKWMRRALESQPSLTLIEGQVETVLHSRGSVTGVRVLRESTPVEDLPCRAVVLTTGTFLNGLCHEGSNKTIAARHGDPAVEGLSRFLVEIGVRLRRFKTGTTPRVKLSSLRLDGLEVLPSEPEAGALSFLHEVPLAQRPLYPCWQTRTSAATHDLLRESLHESALFSGQIEGIGPRYCPSIEDKIVRFGEKDSHPIFLEIEEWDGESVYVQGFSTSLPSETQTRALRTIPGLEAAEVLRPGYAVEYDMADPLQLRPSLMSKQLDGLFLAGQLNGTSGYEEAAGQGIVAGINAGLYVRGEEERLFTRDSSFLGVMIDDLVTKGVEDPYRMLTARAEHRLLLRHDNADLRLTPIARELGVCGDARWERLERKRDAIDRGISALRGAQFGSRHNDLLLAEGLPACDQAVSAFEMIRRPEASLSKVLDLCGRAGFEVPLNPPSGPRSLENEVFEGIELTAKYDGYLRQQARVAERMKQLEEMRIPRDLDFAGMKGLSYETVEKLSRVRPATVGQASRVPGVRPADIALLIGNLRAGKVPLRDSNASGVSGD